MNIFFLDSNIENCAKYHVDNHVIKMRIELAQLLSTAHRILDGTPTKIIGYCYNEHFKIYKKPKTINVLPFEEVINGILCNKIYLQSHDNHPSSIWTRSSLENYKYVVNLALALTNELKFRFNTKEQKVLPVLQWLNQNLPKNLKSQGLTTPLLAMDDKFKIIENNSFDDAIINYRNYYQQGKTHLYKWTNREKPYFLKSL